MKKYYKKYKLLKDTIDYKTGWLFSWEGTRRLYYPHQEAGFLYEGKHICNPYSSDFDKIGYPMEYIESHPEWFKSLGKQINFYPTFPSRNKIGDYLHLSFEIRLMDSVDECRAMNELFDDKKFQDELYDFVKEKYEKKFYK